MLKKWQVFQMRQIWLFCNGYSKENGLQFGATFHRAKNMQYTTQESHWSCSMPKKNCYKKNIIPNRSKKLCFRILADNTNIFASSPMPHSWKPSLTKNF